MHRYPAISITIQKVSAILYDTKWHISRQESPDDARLQCYLNTGRYTIARLTGTSKKENFDGGF